LKDLAGSVGRVKTDGVCRFGRTIKKSGDHKKAVDEVNGFQSISGKSIDRLKSRLTV